MGEFFGSKRVRWTLLALLILIPSLIVGTFWVSKRTCWVFVGEVTCRVETNQKVVALSFDDGPTPEGVDAVLPELQKRGVKATFFLIGRYMDKYPEQGPRLLAAGQELGNHTWSHKRNIFKSYSYYQQQVADADAQLRKAGVAHPVLFRPPFGKKLIGLPWAVQAAGYRMITWDVGDDIEHHPTAADYAKDIIARTRPGSIILIHPMYRHNAEQRKAVPLVLDGLLAKGYKIVPVGELLKLQGK